MKKLLIGLMAIVSIALFSCKKENSAIISSEEEAIISNDAAAEAVIESTDYEVDLYSGSTGSISIASSMLKSQNDGLFGGRYLFGQAPDVTIVKTDGGFPITITLNYGTGTELSNGSIIKGSIAIVVSAAPRTVGAVRTITFNDFYVDSINIAGTRTNTFILGDGNIPTCTIVGDITITFPDGTSLERETEKTRAFIEGYDTPADFSDDKFQITGYTNSVSSEGFTFSATITEPLIRLGSCRFIVEGVVSLAKNDETFSELNYGDGTCDNLATISKNGETKQITLGKRYRIRNI
jgi:hypothetical protein